MSCFLLIKAGSSFLLVSSIEYIARMAIEKSNGRFGYWQWSHLYVSLEHYDVRLAPYNYVVRAIETREYLNCTDAIYLFLKGCCKMGPFCRF